MYYGLTAEQAGRTVNFRSISLWNFQETQKNLAKSEFFLLKLTGLKSDFLSVI